MKLKSINKIITEEDARQEAIDIQSFIIENNLSWGEIASLNIYLEQLAEKFNLTEEFKENGLI